MKNLAKPEILRVINFLAGAWVIFIFILFLYYRDLFSFISILSITTFTVIGSVVLFIFILKKYLKVSLPDFRNFQFEFKISFFGLLFLFIYSAWWIVNVLSASYIFSSFNIFLLAEISIVFKLLSIYIFYLLMILLVYAFGRKILKLIKLNFESKLENFVFAIAFGFIPFMLGTYFLGLFKLYYSYIFWVITILLFGFLSKEIFKILKELESLEFKLEYSFDFKKVEVLKTLIFTLLLITLICNFINALKPAPIDTDSLYTYFNVSNLYVGYHQFKPLVDLLFSNMGQNTEMLYTYVLNILDLSFIVHFSFLFFILILVAVYPLAKWIFNDKYAFLVVLFVAYIPFYMHTNKVEMTLAFYSLILCLLFWLWYKKDKLIYLVGFGIIAGILVGIKYNSLFLIVPLSLFVILLSIRRCWINKKQLIKKLLVNSLVLSSFSLLFFAPWGIKNIIYFNQPLYPFLIIKSSNSGVWDSELGEEQIFGRQRDVEIERLKYGFIRISRDSILSPIYFRNLWHSFFKDPYSFYLDGSVILFIVLLLGLLFVRDKKFLIFYLTLLIYFLFWNLYSQGRSWYGFFGIILAYILFYPIFLRFKIIRCVYILYFILVFIIISLPIEKINIEYISGQVGKEDYLSQRIGSYNLMRSTSSSLSEDSKLLIPLDARIAYITKNDQRVMVDVYYSKIGYYFYQKDKSIHDLFKEKSIKYVLIDNENYLSKILEEVRKENVDEYLLSYSGSIPSIFQDIEKFYSFLEENTVKVAEDGTLVLYYIP